MDFLALLLEHWPVVLIALYLGLVGEVVKGIVIPPREKPYTGWRFYFKKTLGIHAPTAGALFGVFPFAPCPDTYCITAAHRVIYYLGAGIVASWAYTAAKKFAQTKIREISKGTEAKDEGSDPEEHNSDM